MPRRIKRSQLSSMKTSPRRVSRKQISPDELNEKIQNKAYELFKKRGSTHGDDWRDWFEAEKFVKSGKC